MTEHKHSIQERLRDVCGCNIETSPCGSEYECRLNMEAADLIDELAEALKELVDWLGPPLDVIKTSTNRDTKYHAVMIDETGCEFGASVDASDYNEAYEKLREDYPEACVDQLETPQDVADRRVYDITDKAREALRKAGVE